MMIRNDSSVSDEHLLSLLESYGTHFQVEIDPEMGLTLDYMDIPFPDTPMGIYITDKHGDYGGLAFIYGAVTVFWTPEDIDRTMGINDRVLRLRMVHEILHHFNQPCHDIEGWLKTQCRIWSFLWAIGGKSGETFFGTLVQDRFYNDLLKGVVESIFNEDNRISERNFRGELL